MDNVIIYTIGLKARNYIYGADVFLKMEYTHFDNIVSEIHIDQDKNTSWS